MDTVLRHPTGLVMPLPPGWTVAYRDGSCELRAPDPSSDEYFHVDYFPSDDRSASVAALRTLLEEKYRPDALPRGSTATVAPIACPLPAVGVLEHYADQEVRRDIWFIYLRARTALVRLSAGGRPQEFARRTPALEKLVAGVGLDAPHRNAGFVGRWRGARRWQREAGIGILQNAGDEILSFDIAADGRARLNWDRRLAQPKHRDVKTFVGTWNADERTLWIVTVSGNWSVNATCERVGDRWRLHDNLRAQEPLLLTRRR